MNQTESTEAAVMAVVSEETLEEGASLEAAVAEDAGLLSEAEEVRAIYPDFNPAAALEDPLLGALLRGEVKPTLRQLYEATHLEDILENRVAAGVQERVASAVSEAVAAAVATAVRETEERLLSHIRARGRRPAEVGAAGGAGIRMHPAVNRLTRKERAMLAKRAENGETIQF
jgi:hypothetical protein